MSALSGKISYGCPRYCLARGASSPEESRESTSRASDKDLWKSTNTSTFTCTVSQSLSWTKKTQNVKYAVKSGTSTKCRDGGTGRRSGLKIRRYFVPWGFDSPSRHQSNPLRGHQLGRTTAPERRCSGAPFLGIFRPIVPELCPNSISSDAADFC